MIDDYTKYLAIPWKDKGRDYSGCDCWGLVRLFLKDDCGLDLAALDGDYATARDVQAVRELADREKARWIPIKPQNAQKGDVVELSLSRADYHVGVMINEKMVLHIEHGSWPVIALLGGKRIRGRLRGIFRYVG